MIIVAILNLARLFRIIKMATQQSRTASTNLRNSTAPFLPSPKPIVITGLGVVTLIRISDYSVTTSLPLSNLVFFCYFSRAFVVLAVYFYIYFTVLTVKLHIGFLAGQWPDRSLSVCRLSLSWSCSLSLGSPNLMPTKET